MTYTTVQGDTWDVIAYKVYGHEDHMTILLQANPGHADTVIFSGGVQLIVPPATAESSENLPPWKRRQ
ncbi:tail protein X [Paenibacillus sp. GYB004]|uniref:tail protein X n=1 Tax=Paenibacillus sp. GYB004 TaxID=2994393 RepID=UPI002F961902